MLVLSRGRNDKVVFPSLGIAVEILRVEGRNVRLGVEAPRDIAVLRGELVDKEHAPSAKSSKDSHGGLTHSIRNRLQKATLGLRVLQRMLETDNAADAEGTIFKIFSELKSLEAELNPPSAGVRTAPDGSPGRRALVVEDDPNESKLLASYLSLSGFEVNTAIDGLQAMVELSKSDRPDVVLLDMKMPRFDGPKTVSAIRQDAQHRSLKIFAVTGTDPCDAAVEIGPQGVDRWFRKPVDPEALVQAIRQDVAVDLATA